MTAIKLSGFATQPQQTISSRQRLPLPDGTFRVLNAWDEQPSDYTVTASGGWLRSATSDDPGSRINLGDACHYLESRDGRLGELLGALSASTSQPGAGPGREEEFMMGGQ